MCACVCVKNIRQQRDTKIIEKHIMLLMMEIVFPMENTVCKINKQPLRYTIFHVLFSLRSGCMCYWSIFNPFIIHTNNNNDVYICMICLYVYKCIEANTMPWLRWANFNEWKMSCCMWAVRSRERLQQQQQQKTTVFSLTIYSHIPRMQFRCPIYACSPLCAMRCVCCCWCCSRRSTVRRLSCPNSDLLLYA